MTGAAALLMAAMLQSGPHGGPHEGLQRPRASQPAGAAPRAIRLPAQADKSASARRSLLMPVQGVPVSALQDTFSDARDGGRRGHQALDIPAPRGTPVLAVDDGHIAKLFTSKPGGLTIYHFDSTRRHSYYYAHLDRYAEALREGMPVRRGQLLGYVGSSGNASPDAPHLHFAVFRLEPGHRWWEGDPVDPLPLLRGSSSAWERSPPTSKALIY